MRVYNQIKELMCDELEHISRKNALDMNSLEVVYKAVDVIKDIDTIEAMEDFKGSSYAGASYIGNSMNGQDGYSGMYPMGGYSFERGRGANAQRDNQGRYADGYLRDNGYYAGSSNTKEELQRLMDKATNETEKEAIRVAIESMNN